MLKQTEIANKVGVSKSFICDILHERRRPSASTAEKLEKATGIDIRAWLMPQLYYNDLIFITLNHKYSYMQNIDNHKDKGENTNGLGNCNTKKEKI